MTSRKFNLVRWKGQQPDLPIVDWTDDGVPLYVDDAGRRQRADYLPEWPNGWYSEERHDIRVIPGGGWSIAHLVDGALFLDPVIAWRFEGERAEAVTVEDAECLTAAPINRTGEGWFVPPGDAPFSSRYRWNAPDGGEI